MVEQKILLWKNRINQTMNKNNNVGVWTWRGSSWGGVDPNEVFEVWRNMGSDRRCWIWGRVSCGELGWWIEDSPVTMKVVEQEILYWKNRGNQMMNTNNNVEAWTWRGSIWGGVDPNEEFEVWEHTLDEVQARWKFRSHMGSKGGGKADDDWFEEGSCVEIRWKVL